MKYNGITHNHVEEISCSQKLRMLLMNLTKIETSIVYEMFRQIPIFIISDFHKSLCYIVKILYLLSLIYEYF